MAEEVPVGDILCEAMEYLSKLGSNLKTRTDSLKEKKIRKDKLKNPHSIHKAAKKVLLICELSKRSLENVEKGVQKILSKVDTTQSTSSVGGKNEVDYDSEKDTQFQQFKYYSRTLRIYKTVPIKHYMSAKVYAKNMSLSIQNKYPVYCDCKLYRMRNKNMRKSIEKLQIEMEDEKLEIHNATQNVDSCTYEISNCNKLNLLNSNGDTNENNTAKLTQEADMESRSVEDTFSNKHVATIQETDLSVSDENNAATVISVLQSPEKIDEQMLESKNNDTCSINKESETCEIVKSDYKKLKNNLADESGSSGKDQIQVTDNIKSKKHKFSRIQSNSSDENENIQNNDSKTRLNNELSTGDKKIMSSNSKHPKKRKMSMYKSDEDNNMKREQPSIVLNEQANDDTEKSEESATPQLKCVNIFKLLKPDIANNLQNKSEKSKISVTHSRDMTYKNMNTIKSPMPQINSEQKSKHMEYLTRKRKEVLAFKPKKFVIKLDKLPSLSKALLHSYKLKRITQNGSVLCELNLAGEHKIKDSEAVKNNLLNDSSTDDITIRRLSIEGEKVKHALLYDSDSDNQQNNDKYCSKAQRLNDDKGIENEAQMINNENIQLPSEDISKSQSGEQKKVLTETNRKSSNLDENLLTENIKRSLLYESDVDIPDTETNNLPPKEISKSSNSNLVDKSDMFKAAEKRLGACNNAYHTTEFINEVENTDALKSKPIKDNKEITSENNSLLESEEINLCTNTITLANQKPTDNNTCESSNNNTALDKEITLAKEGVVDSLINVSNNQVKTDTTMKSQNELQCTDGKKSGTDEINDENKKLKDLLLCESDSDNQYSIDNISMRNDYNFEIIKRKSLNVYNDCKTIKDTEVTTDVDNHKKYLLQQSDSDMNETNNSSNKKNDENNSAENEGNSKCNNSNVTETNVSDGKDNSSVNESEISINKIKLALLNSSDNSESDNKKPISILKQRRKLIRESIKARKMLMRHSSSSDEDVPNKERFRDHKHNDKLITEVANEIKQIKKKKRMRSISSSSGSHDENLVNRVKQHKYSKLSRTIEREEETEKHEDSKGSQSAVEENQNVDEKCHGHSDSSSSQMVRSKSKPGSSISHNSDTQDDKDVDRLTNLENLANPRRRRDSTCSNNKKETITTGKSKNMSKGTSLIGEELLNAESSSESHSEDENIDDDEELPAVTLSGINNGIGHISKDDLLIDSDSSVSQNDKTPENIQDDSDEENVKSKRRKGNTISSDSEVGASRKKERDVKLSDFEDSDDSSEATKRTKRTKKATDSDASMSSTDANKKKRRRIKQINESDLSDSDGETEGRNKHGRKNIRKVMGKDQLEEATKKAAREEKERIARIAERQKLYNNLEFDESGKPDEVVLEKVVLDFDPETKEPLIEVDRGLVKKLKPHQANGIKFMWDACFESVKRIKKDRGSGCILAHCMGLGKTLQVISLTHTLLTHGTLTGVNRVLVVCPLSTVLNWVNEFRMWLKHAESEFEVDVYELSKNKQNMERASQLNQWFQGGGVCVLGYEMFRNLSADNNKKFKKKMLKSFQESLVDPGPDLVVCDEGHLLKNEKTSLSQSMNKVKTRRRIVLTGTPLQNNLKEYYCMVQFVKPNLLGKYNEYLNRFVNPITNGQYTDSTEHDIRVMKRRSHVLHKMLDGAVQRRDYGVLAPFLPPKHEYVLFITLSDVQVQLYQTYLDNYSRRPQPGKSSGFLFPDFQSLQRIWTHPLVLKYNSERYEIMQQKKREREEDDSEGSLVDFIDDDSTPEETSTDESTDVSSDVSDNSRKKSKKKKSSKKNKGKDKVSTRRGTRANPVTAEQDEEEPISPDVVEVKYENPTEWWIKLVSDDELEDIRNSHKLVLLFDILRQCETIGDKLLVFSQSLYSLDLIEHFLGKVDEATQEGRMDEKLGGHFGSWSPGVDYFRLDGSTSCENRSIWCKNFNREDNPRARLFLISTRAGGLGINLVAANRVVIFDVSWNPSHDVQSIFRVYRFGQKKPCYVYRFLAMGTMEEKIYERQVTKQAISKRVIDEQQIDRHYAENDLAELYKFEPKPAEPRELPALPKDRLFAEMLREHEAQIYKYHEHDSLLENKEEETLTEEERKAAWEDFENEKNKPPPAPFPTAWPMHNGMMPNLLAQQQQAYAMLAAMMGKDMANVNDNQLRDMLPLLYNSPGMFGGYDYGMMQKMNNYKYAQPGMMNPMLASVMNPAAGSGMGGTSGLQYEPPWQRQHQQQLRLQQLMQQQSSMGAKYYAGGLGSRDPVAMALQQQRAREIMLTGGGAGGGVGGAGASALPAAGSASRPRGRPPLQARIAAPTGPADVVNLDSD